MRLIDADALVGGTYYVSQNERFVGYTQQEIDDAPTVQPCEDAVSRQAAIEAVINLCKYYTPTKSVNHPHMDFVIEALQELPSVTPQKGIPVSEKSCNTCGQECAIKYHGCSNWIPNTESEEVNANDYIS